MPWVGGELARAALQNGREAYGIELIRQYAGHLRRTGGAQVWYFPDGTPGFRTTNEVNYAGWGMAQWVQALVEGLGGVRDEEAVLREVSVSPRWAATPLRQARVTFRYAASDGYFAYEWKRTAEGMRVDYTGSGVGAHFRVLLPDGSSAKSLRLEGKDSKIEQEKVGPSSYVVFDAGMPRGSVVIGL